MSEERARVYGIGIVCTLIAFLIGSCAVKADRETQAIGRMVAAGADPIAAKCAIQSADSRDPVCLSYVNTRQIPR